MPFYYMFLFGIAGVVLMADHYLYEYKYWYIQGVFMILMVIVCALVFGCDRIRTSKRESIASLAYEPEEVNEQMAVSVLRNGIKSEIALCELTVGDVIHLSAQYIVPADCAIFNIESQQDFLIDETAITGEPELQQKWAIMNNVNQSNS